MKNEQNDKMTDRIPHEQKPFVRLTEGDGNAFAIIGRVSKALKLAGYDYQFITNFHKEALSGDYDNLLTTCLCYVRDESEKEE